MRIFVTGATGFLGSAIVSDLLRTGHRVTGLARSDAAATALVATGAEVQRGSLQDLESLRRGAAMADAVIHTAFDHDFAMFAQSCEMDSQTISAIGDALAGSDKQFIVTSGLPVTSGQAARENDVPPAGGHSIPRTSEQTAMALLERGVRAAVVRMPQIHDHTKQGFASFLLAHAREKRVSAYVGEGLNRWPAVHRLDAARLYRHVLEKGTAGERYHAVSEEQVCVREIAEAIGRRLHVPVVALPLEASEKHFDWLDRVARMDVPASSALTQERLDWHPRERGTMVDSILNSVL